jgi:hypothetical protein
MFSKPNVLIEPSLVLREHDNSVARVYDEPKNGVSFVIIYSVWAIAKITWG